MTEYKVLITTSGLGSRLGQLTDYTNKSLIRVANKPAISYIVESYPMDVLFVISLGHFGDHIKQFLTLAYPDRNFTFVEVDKYKGEGSSLGYSILQCKDHLQCPFIFHASDTILLNRVVVEPTINYIIGSYKKDSSQYRTLNLNNEKLVRVNEKDEMGFDFCYVGVAGIRDYASFFTELTNLVEQNPNQDISDVHAINHMVPTHDFFYNQVNSEDWFDVGNIAELARTRESFTASIEVLDKKDESIFFFDNFVIKFFADSKTNLNRVKRSEVLRGLVPQILDYTENFYKYKKAEGILFSKSVDSVKFKKFLDWSKENLWTNMSTETMQERCYRFYVDKTNNRINTYLKDFVDVDEVNGVQLPNIKDLITKISNTTLCNGLSSRFHGDFILDNVIETKDGFCLIDWRQDFDGDLIFGDVYYDLAKLNHNLTVNHDLINKGHFNSDPNNCYILTSSKLNECKEILHQFILDNELDLNRVKMLTSIIWINMAPLHEYPFNKFFYNFGKYNLYIQLTKQTT
jgi:choline kinase